MIMIIRMRETCHNMINTYNNLYEKTMEANRPKGDYSESSFDRLIRVVLMWCWGKVVSGGMLDESGKRKKRQEDPLSEMAQKRRKRRRRGEREDAEIVEMNEQWRENKGWKLNVKKRRRKMRKNKNSESLEKRMRRGSRMGMGRK